MTKILKKVQLSTEQSTPKSADPTKGTQTNPYTQVEMTCLQEEGTWSGGYVEGMGYMAPRSGLFDSGSDGVSYGFRCIKYTFDANGYFVSECSDAYKVVAGGATYYLDGPLLGADCCEIAIGYYYDVFRGSMDLFKFLADHTQVEWAVSYNSLTDEEVIINTIHDPHNCELQAFPEFSNYAHSHLQGPTQSVASDDDVNTCVGLYRDYLRTILGKPNYNSHYHHFYIYLAGSNTMVNFDDVVISMIKQYYPNLWEEYNN